MFIFVIQEFKNLYVFNLKITYYLGNHMFNDPAFNVF